MALDYSVTPEVIIKRLEAAHNAKQSIIRAEFFKCENRFFRENVLDECVLIVGSGLGHDTFELAQYNKKVVGIEILKSLVIIAREGLERLSLLNVRFQVTNLFTYRPQKRHDTSILNMGTIGNFDNKSKVIQSILTYSSRLCCDFYLEDKVSLKRRKEMYEQEGWNNVRIEGEKVVSDDGLESNSIRKSDLSNIVNSLGFSVRYHEMNDFSMMAEIYSK